MDYIDPKEASRRLRQLTEEQLDAVRLRCQGLEYKLIADRLHVSKSTVTQRLQRAFIALGIAGYPEIEQTKALLEYYLPLLEKEDLTPEQMGAEAPHHISDEAEEAVYKTENVIDVEPEDVSTSRATEKERRQRSPVLIGLGWGVILGILLSAGVIYAFLRFNGSPILPISQPSPTVLAPTNLPTVLALPSSTVEASTNTPVVIVVTATPPLATAVPTSLPTAAITLPFSDNFDSGPNSEWQILSGKWITADGRFTPIQNPDGSWMWAVLDEPTWQNYRVSVNVQIPYPGSAAQGQVAVVVRISANQSKYLGFWINWLLNGQWANIGTGGSDEQSISGSSRVGIPAMANIEVDVNGNSFTALVNGQQYQQIILTGYPQGGVGLGVLCGYDKCPSFDNFKIEPTGP